MDSFEYPPEQGATSDERERIKRLEEVLGTLISWVAQSAVSPISRAEATKLLDKLNK